MKRISPLLRKIYEASLDRTVLDRDTDMVSDIRETWQDPTEVQQDVREFLMGMYEASDGATDFKLDDMIDAIENGIRDFRKMTNM